MVWKHKLLKFFDEFQPYPILAGHPMGKNAALAINTSESTSSRNSALLKKSFEAIEKDSLVTDNGTQLALHTRRGDKTMN